MDRADIKSMSLSELSEKCRAFDLPAFRAKQIYKWLQVRGVASFDEMTDLSRDLRGVLAEHFEILFCSIKRKQVSALDGTVKYLFELNDGELIESVVMKYKYGYTICVSTQVGCKMNCAFCASGLSGFVRDLYPSEILSQIHAAQNDLGIQISHIVLMGMGEPLDNFDNVMKFLDIVSNPDGLNISMRKISLSTSGIVPRIYDLLEKKLQLTLSISLHAPNDEIRSRIMPVNKKYGIDELLKACRTYAKTTSRRISFEYALISGVTDTDECAVELASKLKNMLCHVNLIPVNEVTENSFKRPGAERTERFMGILENNGINATVRRSLGSDIDASCGQLRNRHKKGEKSVC
ncbi:MAG: 23S rRNA (adenine(2503)-C(2))-methyltransferase RlmN [Clostridiales bacterium]|nr:23S rRNA (adenine(2503)-C(2))-methyltransferase RlmN [Clostridiales bacterium]